jgi:hypothetical protein
MDMRMRYQQQTVSFLTMHGKERVIAPVLAQALGCQVCRVDGFDTDSLGSFSREIPRLTSALDTCRRKAEIGMGLSHTALGLASEGSFNTDPWSGLLPWNVEILVFIDAHNGWEIVGTAQGPAHNQSFTASDWASMSALARQHGFPAHQLCLRPSTVHDPRVIKGIDSWGDLKLAFDTCLQRSDQGWVHAESELRAFGNPTRMAMIERAAHDLAQKISQDCPQCHSPGYQVVSHRSGLPCAACGLPTRMATHAVWRCAYCQHSHEAALAQSSHADPSRCDNCNP